MADGTFRYTRDGAFGMDALGNLVTRDGYLLADAVTIPPGAVNVTIGQNGLLEAVVNGQMTQVGQLQLYNVPNPAGLSSEGGNLYAETAASGVAVAGNPGDGTQGLGVLRSGFLEKSNVEVVTELISLITAQRAYEINSRAIRAGDEMLSTTTDIVR
jgi:flagellar basal-body rod protein FlgG